MEGLPLVTLVFNFMRILEQNLIKNVRLTPCDIVFYISEQNLIKMQDCFVHFRPKLDNNKRQGVTCTP